MNISGNNHDAFILDYLRWKDAAMSQEEGSEFEAQLSSDPQKRQWFLDLQYQETAITEYFRNNAIGGKTVKFDATERKPRLAKWLWPIAALFVVSLVGMWIKNDVKDLPTGITLEHADTAIWEGKKIREGDPVELREYRLAAGSVRFRTDKGATISIGGPAHFRYESPTQLILETGRAMAKMHQKYSEFTILTKDLKVTDLGTVFGVSVDPSEGTLLSVFEGKVEAKPSKSEKSGVHLITEGNSMIRDLDSDKALLDIPYNTTEFEDLWPLTMGIDDASNQVRFVLPGANENLSTFRSDDNLFLLPEKRGQFITEKLSADLNEEHPVFPNNKNPNIFISANQKVDSYMLYFNPVSDEAGIRKISGEIEFAMPVIGVIAINSKIKGSDNLLGDPTINYAEFNNRGLESQDLEVGEGKTLARDELILSPDRTRLYFRMQVGVLHDYIRIVTESSY